MRHGPRTDAASTSLALSLAAVLLTVPGCAPRPALVMSFKQYAQVRHPVPYILSCERGRGGLLYFGAKHCFDPADPQMAEIERLWSEFRPTRALNEGWDPPVAATRDEAITRYGEPGLLRWLAHRDGVPIDNLEPTPEAEARDLLQQFTPEKARLFYCLRTLAQDDARPAASRAPTKDGLVVGTLEWLDRVPGLRTCPQTLDEFAAACARLLPPGSDWQHPPMEWFDPVPRPGQRRTWLNEVARRASEYRDVVIVQRLVRGTLSPAAAASPADLATDTRVFAVIGASHVVMQEPALRVMMNRVTRIPSQEEIGPRP